MQKVASAAENSNLSLEKTASWIATISSMTREGASTIGRSIATSISRYESIQKAGFNSDDETELNDVVQALTAVGLEALDSSGQLRDYGEVMDDLGENFKDLSKNEQSYIATTMFGAHQRNRGITLLQNYNESLKNYESAMNSAGAVNEKFDIYTQSAQAHTDEFKASVDGLWQDTLSSDSLKKLIDFGTAIVDIVSKLGLVPTAITLISVALFIFAKRLKFVNVTTITNGILSLGRALLGLILPLQGATLGATAFGKALLTIAPVAMLALAIAAWVALNKVIDESVITASEQKVIVKELTEEYKGLQAETEMLNSELDNTISRMEELNGKDTLTLIEKDELRRLQESNTELERKLKVQKAIEDIKKEELANETALLMNKKEKAKMSESYEWDGYNGLIKVDKYKNLTPLEQAEESILAMQAIEIEFDKLKEKQDKGKISADAYQKKQKELSDSLVSQKKIVSGLYGEFEQYAKNLSGSTDPALRSLRENVARALGEMDEALTQTYQKTVLTNTDMINRFNENYKIDLTNFKNLQSLKIELENRLYSDIKNINDDMIDDLAARYGVNLSNFKDTEKMKVAIAANAAKAIVKTYGIAQGITVSEASTRRDIINRYKDSNGLSSQEQSYLDEYNSFIGASYSNIDKALAEIDSVVTNYQPSGIGDGVGKDSSDSKNERTESTIGLTDATKALVDALMQQVRLDERISENLERRIKQAEREKDHNKTLELQNELYLNQRKTLEDIYTANKNISSEADKIRNTTKYDTESWFNPDGTDSTAYIALLNSFAGLATTTDVVTTSGGGTNNSGGGGNGSVDLSKMGRVTSKFGNRAAPMPGASTNHRGVDIVLSNDNVPSVFAGVVKESGYSSSMGNYIKVQKNDGTVATYMHLASKAKYSKGATVQAGTSLGVQGNTGRSKGKHLHLGIQTPKGDYINPLSYMAGGTGKAGTTSTATPTTTSVPSEAQKQYDSIIKLHGALSTLKSSWWDNDTAANALKETIWETEDRIKELTKSILEFKLSSLEEEKSDYEKALSAVLNLIDEQIEKLNEEKEAIKSVNEEKERQIELEKLQENLENARNQKNKRIYRSGRGFVWESDQEEIKKSQEAINKFKVDEQIREIDKQIDAWNEYKKTWEDTTKGYEIEANKLHASQMIHANWEGDILNKRLKAVNDFKDGYLDAMKQIGSIQNQIGSLENSNFLVVGADGNAPSGSKAGDIVATAGGNFLVITKEDYDIGKKSGEDVRYNSTTGTYSKKITEDSGSKKPSSSSSSSNIAGTVASGFVKAVSDTIKNTFSSIKGAFTGKKYSSGGVADFTGFAQLDGSKTKSETIFNSTDSKKLYDLVHEVPDLKGYYAKKIAYSIPDISNNISKGHASISIGDIYLSEVNDADSLSKAIVQKLPSLVLQNMFKK